MKRGFTLIELLVVVAIIVVLIAILLPSLGRAREQAKSVKCLSLVRQFVTTSNVYADESNEWFVPARTAAGGFWFANDLYRHEMNFSNSWGTYPRSFICPNSIDLETEYAPGMHKIENTYGMNYEGLPGPYYGYKRTSLISPGTKLMFADANDKWINWWCSNLYTAERLTGGSYTTAAAYRHIGSTINVGFFDGHAETLRRPYVDRTLSSNNNARDIWNPLK